VSSADDDAVRLDLNNPELQQTFFALEKEQTTNVVGTLRKTKSHDVVPTYADRD
jgi:hypothetical protein